MWMIGLPASHRLFFIRRNPNAAAFTPNFNKICDWNFGLSCCHQYLLGFIQRVSCPHARMATCDGNEEGLASFAVRDSNTAQLAAAHFGNAAVSEIRLPLESHFR